MLRQDAGMSVAQAVVVSVRFKGAWRGGGWRVEYSIVVLLQEQRSAELSSE